MNMRMTLSERWKKNDKSVNMIFNFTDVRAEIDFVTPAGNITNGTLLSVSPLSLSTGDNIVYNDTATREIHLVANGLNWKRNPVSMVAYRCIGPCLAAINDTAIESTFRYWSDIASWGSLGRLPLAGEDVEIKSGWNMILDLPSTPLLNML